MKTLIANNFLQKILKMSADEVMLFLYEFLTTRYGYDHSKVHSDFDNYMVFKGDMPVGICTHVDTVLKKEPTEILYDPKLQVMWSTSGGLGADDRAGIVGALEIVNMGYRPTLIFCNYEESGGIGARVLSRQDFLKEIPMNYLIEIDRKGENDCVFYDDGNDTFHEYVENFGFKTAWGTFSDISTLCPALGISGVNLSTGYYNEHTSMELLRVGQLRNTVAKIAAMMEDLSSVKEPFKFVKKHNEYEGYYGYFYGYGFPSDDDIDYWERSYTYGERHENKNKYYNSTYKRKEPDKPHNSKFTKKKVLEMRGMTAKQAKAELRKIEELRKGNV